MYSKRHCNQPKVFGGPRNEFRGSESVVVIDDAAIASSCCVSLFARREIWPDCIRSKCNGASHVVHCVDGGLIGPHDVVLRVDRAVARAQFAQSGRVNSIRQQRVIIQLWLIARGNMI